MMNLPKELLRDVEARRVLLFLGSGASFSTDIAAGFPTAKQLASHIQRELLDESSDTDAPLSEVAQRALWARGGRRDALESLLTKVFANPTVKPLHHHSLLPLLGLPLITTNYDQLIEQAYHTLGGTLSVVLADADIPSASDHFLIKIHGCISRPETCIVSEDDYYRWLSEETELKNFVRALFTTLRVVFVGYSVADINFRLLLSELRRKVGPSLKAPLIVSPVTDPTAYNYHFAVHSLGAQFIEQTAASFLTSLADTYRRTLIPYTDRYRTYYFQQPDRLTQPFVDYAAERLLSDLQSNEAGPLHLDLAVVSRVFVLASSQADSLYGTGRRADPTDGFVYVPPGEFIMGGSRLGNERLRVERTVAGFLIQDDVVCNKEYRAFVEYIATTGDHSRCHPSEPHHKDHHPDSNFSGASSRDVLVSPLPDDYFTNAAYDAYPVVNVDWWDAYAFASWKGWRLPTELEWEKAARGIDGRIFPYGNEFNSSISNVAEAKILKPVQTRSYPEGRSPYGCFNMSGNVWEWCADAFESTGSTIVDTRVVRGGSCTRGRERAVAAFRNGRHVNDRWVTRGFRCVRTGGGKP